MSITTVQPPSKSLATKAAAQFIFAAVASDEQSAEFVRIQWHYGNFPLHKNVNSADIAELAAMQFSGKYAEYAICAEKCQ